MSDFKYSDFTNQKQAEATASRRQMFDSIKAMEDAVHAWGWNQGYEQGWNEGFRAAIEQMQQAAAMQAQTQPPEPEQRSRVFDNQNRTANEIVMQIILNEPGLRGVEIVERTQELNEPVKERTVRTALHRLKGADQIYNDDERWYPVDQQNEESEHP